MTALFTLCALASVAGAIYSARLEGYVAGLKRGEQQRRQAVEEHRDWLYAHIPRSEEWGLIGPCNGTEQRDSL